MAETEGQTNRTEDIASVKEEFKYSASHFMTTVIAVILLTSALAVILSLCTDFMYDTDIFHVPAESSESVRTVSGSFEGEFCRLNVNFLKVSDDNVYIEFSAESDRAHADKLADMNIMLVKYGKSGNMRECVYYPTNNERSSSELPDGNIRTDCSMAFFAPDPEDESDGFIYCIRVYTKTEEGTIDIIYND